MKLSSINEWLTLGANLGVLVGLMFLIIEISQNTRVAQASAYQDLISQISEINYLQASDDDLATSLVVSEGDQYLESLNPVQRGKLDSLRRIVLRHGDLAYYQYELGLIDEVRLNSALGPLRGHLSTDSGKAIWEVMRPNLTDEYMAYVEHMMADIEPDEDFWK